MPCPLMRRLFTPLPSLSPDPQQRKSPQTLAPFPPFSSSFPLTLFALPRSDGLEQGWCDDRHTLNARKVFYCYGTVNDLHLTYTYILTLLLSAQTIRDHLSSLCSTEASKKVNACRNVFVITVSVIDFLNSFATQQQLCK